MVMSSRKLGEPTHSSMLILSPVDVAKYLVVAGEYLPRGARCDGWDSSLFRRGGNREKRIRGERNKHTERVPKSEKFEKRL